MLQDPVYATNIFISIIQNTDKGGKNEVSLKCYILLQGGLLVNLKTGNMYLPSAVFLCWQKLHVIDQ